MRVIAGSAKGVRLGPVPRGVRPVSDMAREGVFSSLGPDVAGARVLDLYAGTGAMAIEALSRGAERATLVERDRAALGAIRDNLARARVAEAADVVASDVLPFLTRDDNPLEGFDLVFADPPYAMEQDGARRPGRRDRRRRALRARLAGGPDASRNGLPRLSFRYTGLPRGDCPTATPSSSYSGRFRWA